MNLNTFRKEKALSEVEGGLIQNIEPISMNQAKLISKKYALRWRFRVCRYCCQVFDIEGQGFGYNCGEC